MADEKCYADSHPCIPTPIQAACTGCSELKKITTLWSKDSQKSICASGPKHAVDPISLSSGEKGRRGSPLIIKNYGLDHGTFRDKRHVGWGCKKEKN